MKLPVIKSRLQQWIDDADLNYSQLAVRAGVSVGAVRTLAKNQFSRVDIGTWEAVCKALGKPIEEMFYSDRS